MLMRLQKSQSESPDCGSILNLDLDSDESRWKADDG